MSKKIAAPAPVAAYVPSAEVVASVVSFSRLSADLASYRDNLKKAIVSEIELSKAPKLDAINALAKVLENTINPATNKKFSKQAVSDLLNSLDLRRRAKKSKSKATKAKEDAAAPLVEKILALLKAESAESAVAALALKKALLSLQCKQIALDAAE